MIARKTEKGLKEKMNNNSFEEQKLELIRLRIQNKYYDREEILQKVVQEIYERDIRNK